MDILIEFLPMREICVTSFMAVFGIMYALVVA
jgi:hypothetical protein